jgi:hypothetical protein
VSRGHVTFAFPRVTSHTPAPSMLLRNASVNILPRNSEDDLRFPVCPIDDFIGHTGVSKKAVLGESFTQKISQSAQSVNRRHCVCDSV